MEKKGVECQLLASVPPYLPSPSDTSFPKKNWKKIDGTASFKQGDETLFSQSFFPSFSSLVVGPTDLKNEKKYEKIETQILLLTQKHVFNCIYKTSIIDCNTFLKTVGLFFYPVGILVRKD